MPPAEDEERVTRVWRRRTISCGGGTAARPEVIEVDRQVAKLRGTAQRRRSGSGSGDRRREAVGDWLGMGANEKTVEAEGEFLKVRTFFLSEHTL